MDPTLRSFFNICSGCHRNLAITLVEETETTVSVKWMFLLVDKIPMVCSKCSFFICKECQDFTENKCGDDCVGTLITYVEAISPEI